MKKSVFNSSMEMEDHRRTLHEEMDEEASADFYDMWAATILLAALALLSIVMTAAWAFFTLIN